MIQYCLWQRSSVTGLPWKRTVRLGMWCDLKIYMMMKMAKYQRHHSLLLCNTMMMKIVRLDRNYPHSFHHIDSTEFSFQCRCHPNRDLLVTTTQSTAYNLLSHGQSKGIPQKEVTSLSLSSPLRILLPTQTRLLNVECNTTQAFQREIIRLTQACNV
jgi:hypothetical protein